MESFTFFMKFQQHFAAWVAQGESARLILIVGSQARSHHPADAHSDLDLEVFGTDFDAPAYLNWLRSYAPVWMVLDDPGSSVPKWLVLYKGGYKVDVSLNPLDGLHEMIRTQTLWPSQQRGYAVLLDRDGVGDQMPQAISDPVVPAPPLDEVTFRKTVEAYWYGSLYVAKQIKRGNLWKVKWADQMQQTTLLTMLEYHARVMQGGAVDVWHNGEFMREWVDERTWQALHGVYAHFDGQDSWRALEASMQLFYDLSKVVAARLHFAYPSVVVHEIRSAIAALKD